MFYSQDRLAAKHATVCKRGDRHGSYIFFVMFISGDSNSHVIPSFPGAVYKKKKNFFKNIEAKNHSETRHPVLGNRKSIIKPNDTWKTIKTLNVYHRIENLRSSISQGKNTLVVEYL